MKRLLAVALLGGAMAAQAQQAAIGTWAMDGSDSTGLGITNSAGANVLAKSDGTNLVASGLTDSGTVLSYDGGSLTYDAPSDLLTTSAIKVTSYVLSEQNIGTYVGSAYKWRGGQDGVLRTISGGGIRWHSSATDASGADEDLYLSRAAAATLQLGAAPNATPVANTLIVGESGSGTDIAGANGVIQSGAGTGAGTGSTLEFKTPDAHGSDAVAQTQTTKLRVGTGVSVLGALYTQETYPDYDDARILGYSFGQYQRLYLSRATLGSKAKAITDGSATAFATFTIADGATYTGEVIYKIKAIQSTSLQALAGRVRFAATREGAVYTVSISEVGTQTLAAAAGTLTGAIEISGAAGVVTLAANFNTSLTPTTFTIDARFDSPDAALALTFP